MYIHGVFQPLGESMGAGVFAMRKYCQSQVSSIGRPSQLVYNPGEEYV